MQNRQSRHQTSFLGSLLATCPIFRSQLSGCARPVDLWRAYKRPATDKVRGNAAGTLADIVMLVRYAIGETEALEPLPPMIAGRFNLWLGREQKAGRSSSAGRPDGGAGLRRVRRSGAGARPVWRPVARAA